MARKPNLVTFANGDQLKVSEREYWNRRGDFQKRLGTNDLSFMRMGRFSLAIGPADIGVAETYADDGDNSRFIPGLKNDRLRQIRKIQGAFARFPNHPFAAQVLATCDAEAAIWNAI